MKILARYFLLTVLIGCQPAYAQPLTPYAGGDIGNNGPAVKAVIGPYGMAQMADGSVIVCDMQNNQVRRIAGGIITAFAGTGTMGSAGDGGPATAAALNGPHSVAVDPAGAVYICDSRNHKIRRVAPNGTITTVAGTGAPGFSGDGGQATAAQLSLPQGIAVSPDGAKLIIADNSNKRVRSVSLTTGVITTIAGTGGFALPPYGDGGPATAATFSGPLDVSYDGNALLVTDSVGRVRRIDTAGIITTIAGCLGSTPCNTPGDGGPSTAAALSNPKRALAVGADLYILQAASGRVRRVRGGTIETLPIELDGAPYFPTAFWGALYVPPALLLASTDRINGLPISAPPAATPTRTLSPVPTPTITPLQIATTTRTGTPTHTPTALPTCNQPCA